VSKKLEYRITWKREDSDVRHRVFKTIDGADRFMTLFGEKPWEAYGENPDELECCDGYGCGCDGLTHRQKSEKRRSSMKKLLFLRKESRVVGDWKPMVNCAWEYGVEEQKPAKEAVESIF